MKTYFNNCNTLDEAKNLFRKLCIELHPDTREDGNKQKGHIDFIELMKEFKAFKPLTDRKEDDNFKPDEFYNIVMQFVNLHNVKITFVGSFIWLEDAEGFEGSTKAQKEKIKTILIDGYNTPRFAFKRLKWYYSPEGYKQKFRSTKTFDEIKSTWGTKSYTPNKERESIKTITA